MKWEANTKSNQFLFLSPQHNHQVPPHPLIQNPTAQRTNQREVDPKLQKIDKEAETKSAHTLTPRNPATV